MKENGKISWLFFVVLYDVCKDQSGVELSISASSHLKKISLN